LQSSYNGKGGLYNNPIIQKRLFLAKNQIQRFFSTKKAFYFLNIRVLQIKKINKPNIKIGFKIQRASTFLNNAICV